MRNPLQEQLLKAGLAKKSRVDQIAREQAKQRNAKAQPAVGSENAEAEHARQQKLERDRALSAERNAQQRAQEQRAQVRQIVEQNRLTAEGDIAYRFSHEGAIRTVYVTDPIRRQLASGTLAIAVHEAGYAIVPRAAADKIAMRDASLIALDHRKPADAGAEVTEASDESYYSRFQVPDDLVW